MGKVITDLRHALNHNAQVIMITVLVFDHDVAFIKHSFIQSKLFHLPNLLVQRSVLCTKGRCPAPHYEVLTFKNAVFDSAFQ